MLDRLCEVLLVQIVRFSLQSNMAGRDVLAGMMHSRIGRVFAEMMDHPGKAFNADVDGDPFASVS